MERGKRTFLGILQGSLGIGAILAFGFCALLIAVVPLVIVSYASEQFYNWGIWPIGAAFRICEIFLLIGFIGGIVIWLLALGAAMVGIIKAATEKSNHD